MSEFRTFFKYVIPSILSFALSGVYAIVDGYFVGNSIGDIGLSTINVAYPITAFLQAVGTGIGMGGAVYYSISRAEQKEKRAMEFMASSLWILIISSILFTFLTYIATSPLLRLLGAEGQLLALGEEYTKIIALGAGLQIIGTGLVPFIRNHGGPFYAMVAMIAGFVANIILDYVFVWKLGQGIGGAALATVIGQGITMLIALVYLLRKKLFTLAVPIRKLANYSKSIIKIGVAPFGLTMTPNISLIIINRFSIYYGGDQAVSVYACIAYIICIVYLILQGVGDGSQPIISQYYGAKQIHRLKEIRKLAYGFGLLLADRKSVV